MGRFEIRVSTAFRPCNYSQWVESVGMAWKMKEISCAHSKHLCGPISLDFKGIAKVSVIQRSRCLDVPLHESCNDFASPLCLGEKEVWKF